MTKETKETKETRKEPTYVQWILIALTAIFIVTFIQIGVTSGIEDELEFDGDIRDNCERIGYSHNYVYESTFLGTGTYYCIEEENGTVIEKKEISNMKEFLKDHEEVNLLEWNEKWWKK